MRQLESSEINNASQSMTVDSDAQRHRAAELVTLFIRAFNAAVAYGDGDDPALKRVQTELLRKFNQFLKAAGSVPLEIGPFELLWEGYLVYEDRDREGLPNILYRGGIRKLDFYLGISDWELTQFFNILRTSRGRKMGAHDLVASLQDGEDFPHVDFIASDDYLEVHPLPIPKNLDDLRRQYPHHVMALARQSKIFQEYCPGSEIDFLKPLSKDHSLRANRFRIFNQIYLVTPEEIEIINSQILSKSAPVFMLDALETLIEVLLMEKSKKDFNRIVSFILGILDHSIKAGDYQGAKEVLKKLYTCLHIASLNEWQKKRIKKAIFEAGTESRIDAIAEGIRSSEGQNLNELTRYVSLLQRNAVPHLCRLLGELKGSKPRRIICDTLADLGRNSIGVFGDFLDDDRWYVVRNVVYIIGRIGKTECLPYLEKALDHPNPRVRREAIQAISMAANRETAIQHLIRKLDDTDGKIRGIAALQLARIGREEALRPLLDLVLSKAFQKREIREIRLFLKAIGITGRDEAVPALFRILLKKSFFGKIKADEIRKSAADALGAIGTNEAVVALRKISKVGDELAKDVSLAVLERIGK